MVNFIWSFVTCIFNLPKELFLLCLHEKNFNRSWSSWYLMLMKKNQLLNSTKIVFSFQYSSCSHTLPPCTTVYISNLAYMSVAYLAF